MKGYNKNMNLKEQLKKDLLESMRQKDELKKRAIRLTLSSIKLIELEKGPLDDLGLISVLQKEIASRQETIKDSEKANRQDLIKINQEEIEFLKTYLPEELSDEKLKELVISAIQETGAVGAQDMGKVMKIVLPNVAGRAPNFRVSQMVKELLSN
jgi:uncharacterized protein YqeY